MCRVRLPAISTNKYCSNICEIASSNHKKEERACANCKVKFVTYKNYPKTYCSFKCVYSHPEWRAKQREQTHSLATRQLLGDQSRARNKGTGNGRYTHGLNTVRRLVQERANTQCEICNLSVGVMKGFLDIHHKNMNHHDNDPNNLIAVCPNCHRIEHLKAKHIL